MMWRLLLCLLASAAYGQVAQHRTTFEVRYIAQGAVYLSGGREEGLQEGFRLAVTRRKPGEPTLAAQTVGHVLVTAVAAHSAVCSIESSTTELQTGDLAEISSDDLQSLQALQQSKTARRYAQVITFTDGDPLEQELRDYVPRPPSPEVNRFRGRVAYEYSSIHDHATGASTDQHGVAMRADIARIAGSYWNLTGYWRGRVNTSYAATSQTQTLRDLLNRTYHIGIYYNNPQSNYVFGAGRLFIPWAVSLNTIDGGYAGRRFGRYLTVAGFGGSTPDPTAWDYKPGRQIGGALLNLNLGSFENVRFSTSGGIAITRLRWKAEREYGFFENTFSWKRYFTVFHNMEVDRLTPGRFGNTDGGQAVSRSFLTVRVQPVSWLSLDAGHNYFRTIPTFDTRLLGAGLLDKYLFSGLSAGLRLELPRRIALYGSLGQSKRSDDGSGSLNQMYGIGFRDILGTGLHADVRRSEFHGAFGSGWYQSVSLSRELGQALRFEVQGGTQEFRSAISSDNRGFWMNSTFDWLLGSHYVLGSGINLYRGKVQDYDQIFVSLGYRF